MEDDFYITHDERELVIECLEKEIKDTEPTENDAPLFVAHAECKIEELTSIIRRMREYL
jgi:hypothetical protein